MRTLPYDVLEHIFHYALEDNDVTVLRLWSSVACIWTAPVQRSLFQTVVLSEDRRHARRLAHHLRRSPHLQAYIQVLVISKLKLVGTPLALTPLLQHVRRIVFERTEVDYALLCGLGGLESVTLDAWQSWRGGVSAAVLAQTASMVGRIALRDFEIRQGDEVYGISETFHTFLGWLDTTSTRCAQSLRAATWAGNGDIGSFLRRHSALSHLTLVFTRRDMMPRKSSFIGRVPFEY
jgi:hypothetical protein